MASSQNYLSLHCKIYSIIIILIISSSAFSSNNEYMEENSNIKLDTISADIAEWAQFDYEAVGLSQKEYQSARNSNLTKSKLLHFLELGIRPNEYLKKPWINLGVSEKKWIELRTAGMEDSDIEDHSDKLHGAAYISLLLPSYYQWKSTQTNKAIGMNVVYGSFWAGFVTLSIVKKDNMKDNLYFLPAIGVVHLWSFLDAIINVKKKNPREKNETFEVGLIPTSKGILGTFSFYF